MAGIGLGLVGLLVGGAFLWATTAGAGDVGLAGEPARGRRRGVLAAGSVLVVVGILSLLGGLVELAR